MAPDPESNLGPSDLHSDALPTELSEVTSTVSPCSQLPAQFHLLNKRFANVTYCRDPGSNRGPSDLQSDALPTELSRHNDRKAAAANLDIGSDT